MKAQTIVAATAAIFSLGVQATFSGTGFGTFYYDINANDGDACGDDLASFDNRDVTCGWRIARTADEVDSDYMVAMNVTQLEAGLSTYCGMKVIVTVNGVKSNLPFFVGDGCQRCSKGSPHATTYSPDGAPGLDFSYTALNALSGGNACKDGYIKIGWEITGDKIYNDFDV